MTSNSHIVVDGINIPVGPTLRGRPAREALTSLLAMPGLRHIERIDPAGNLSVSAGLHPPRIAETLPASAAGEERRWRLGAELQARLAAAGLMRAEGRP